MQTFGLNSPIVVSPESYLIDGLYRLEAAKKLKWSTIWANWTRIDLRSMIYGARAQMDSGIDTVRSAWWWAVSEARGMIADADNVDPFDGIANVVAAAHRFSGGWLAVFQMIDGRGLKIAAGCNPLGWDVSAGGQHKFYPSVTEALKDLTPTEATVYHLALRCDYKWRFFTDLKATYDVLHIHPWALEVLPMAQEILDSGYLDQIPIIGDRMEDAGCNDQELLDLFRCGRANWICKVLVEECESCTR